MIKFYGTEHKETIEKAALKTLEHFELSPKDIDVEINTASQELMQELNKNHRNIDSVTDVLSFANIDKKPPYPKEKFVGFINPTDNSLMLGEIFICVEKAKEQAEEYGHSLEREIGFLVCHGMLHLLGYSHDTPEEEEDMNTLQEKILDELNMKRTNFKSGFVAIMGRPNAGKSTLVNTLVGEKVSIVSWKPQTTRNRILGIYNDSASQIVFIDTPGLHSPRNRLGKYMMRSALDATEGADAVVYIIDGEKGFLDSDKRNLKSNLEKGFSTIAAVNKIDHITKEKVFEILTMLKDFPLLKAIVPISALKAKNTQALLDEIKRLLTDNTKYYPEDMYTDKSLRFMAAEIIREKTLRLLDQEIPYGIGVEVTTFTERQKKDMIDIEADIICEKASHKPIILGKGGSMIKKIGMYARQDLEELTQKKVFLTLFVKVEEDWRSDENMLRDLGYHSKN